VARVKFSEEWTLKLLDCFTVFARISLAMAELQDFTQLRQNHRELKKCVTKAERRTIFRLNVDTPSGALFSRFNLWLEFRIYNQYLFLHGVLLST
jgi:hypothetical protein